jgi:ATP-dependent Clp protease ATP-binding subunit ClpA
MREALGDALFSRFDSLIGFQPLTRDEIGQVMDRLVDGRFAKLEPYEQTQLNLTNVKGRLYEFVDKFANVRQLGKFVDEVISL